MAENDNRNVEDGAPITIKDGNEISFRVKPKTPFQKIFNAYYQKTQQDQNLLKFLFDGQRVRPEETPADLQMEEGDSIDAMINQMGGC
ncbi:hypothetical protein CHLNCDRAFT_138857 [Chlorella variabilis]|uniref:Small ubiquitin-related modifier n=1 Tax=Chlorella variabilis TaxID=554065 RepID=E1ZP72_CHLVA|nr:hypothetical protein CHLNCDRAFT_138857 [Chlorella variabilis]EFN52489.1 hypothetical protein CHLNCDRAFT_138857 [Chlorella variabilis]|eukprot:XP_005844591.1 hypothetical protein CHLNCDRAFT_138857 [Chlorella variabilis]